MPPTTKTYPGPLLIERANKLTSEQRRVERRFAQLIQASPRVYVAAYLYHNGKRLNTDDARELCDEYAVSKETRARMAAAVQEPAGAVVKDAWRERMKFPNGTGVVVFTAGGAGSGKTSAIQDVSSAKVLEGNADAVYDTTMSNFDSSKKKVQEALDAKKEVIVYYVYRPLELAIRGVLERAEKRGHTVPLGVLAHDHYQCPRTFIQIVSVYRATRFTGIVLNNGGAAGQASIVDLDFLKDIVHNHVADLSDVRRRVRKVVQDEYDKRARSKTPVPDYVYRGIIGKGP